MTMRWACAGLIVLGVTTAAYAQSSVDPLEATMWIAGERDAGRSAMPLVEERLHVTIDAQHATTTLLQVFEHRGAGQIEGRYRLRPGIRSHVDGFAYWNGEDKIVGEVFERQAAHEVYDRITAQRRDPGLLEEDGTGAFAFKVFPIQPGEHKRIELRWSQWLERRARTVRYRAPLTRGDAEIVIAIDGAPLNLRSPTHRIHIERTATGARVRSDGARAPGELVLEWELDAADWTPTAFVQANGDQDGWFALAVAAPTAPDSVAAKDVTLVIDRSGSMAGEAIAHAKTAAADMIRLLREDDRINVIAFSDEVDPLFSAPQPADAAHRNRAIAFVDRLREGGGTNLPAALTAAIQAQDVGSANGRARVVVFMTDGQSNLGSTLAAANADTKDIRLFTVGLGRQVDKPLLSRLAATKRGRFVYIDRASAIEDEIRRLAASIASPVLIDVSLEVEGAQAVRIYPRTLPDVFTEDELVITGRIRGLGKPRFIVRGKLAGKPVELVAVVDQTALPSGSHGAAPRPWIAALWAHARVDHLLEDIALGNRDPELVTEVTDLALTYNFVTPYTAFLAVPESELGAAAPTVRAARERKARILAASPDVTALRGETMSLESTSVGDILQATPRHRPRGGCAGCASGQPGGAAILFAALAFVAIALLRRRSAPAARG